MKRYEHKAAETGFHRLRYMLCCSISKEVWYLWTILLALIIPGDGTTGCTSSTSCSRQWGGSRSSSCCS